MTYDEQEARRKELRDEDPCGRSMTNNDIDRIVAREDLADHIDSLPDCGDAAIELKHILRDLLALVP